MSRLKPIPLQAGPLHLLYENGMIRSVFYGKIECIRRVYMALRDQFWNTIPYSISSLKIDKNSDSFHLSFTADHNLNDINFTWQGSINGTDKGELSLLLKGECRKTFLRNRIGWCILHPIELCSGTPCAIVKQDDSIVRTSFPGTALAPHQLFTDITSMTYPVTDTTACTLHFSGDLFETEDQRNWTDASFKTYSTPQSLPSPVTVTAGTNIEQGVTIRLSGRVIKTPPPDRSVPTIDFTTSFSGMSPFPHIGLCCPYTPRMTKAVLRTLRHLGLHHLRFDIRPETSCTETYTAIAAISGSVGCSAELAIHLSGNYEQELGVIAVSLATTPISVARLLILRSDMTVTPPETAYAARHLLGSLLPDTCITIGTNRYFIEINRTAPETNSYDALCFSATPQVHTFDNRVIMENIEGLAACARDAQRLSEGKPVVLSPLTLRPRKDPLRPQKSGGADSRQMEPFGAAWLLGAIGICATSGIQSLTCLNTVGPEGIMDEAAAELFPVYHILSSGIIDADSIGMHQVRSNDKMIAAITTISQKCRMLFIINQHDETIEVTVTGMNKDFSLCRLNDTCRVKPEDRHDFWRKNSRQLVYPESGIATLFLAPYEVVRIVQPK